MYLANDILRQTKLLAKREWWLT